MPLGRSVQSLDFALNPFPSQLCKIPNPNHGPPSIHLCFFDGTVERTFDLTDGTAGDLVGVEGPQSYTGTGAQDQWGFGMMLIPYLLDWGDKVKQIVRSQAHVTILRAFPDSRDRRLALLHLSRFTWVTDDCTTPLERFLIGHPEHVGYKWNIRALKEWFDAVTTDSGCGLAFQELDRTAAIEQARIWLEISKPFWESLTRQRFPFDLKNMAGYWDPTYDDAPLPRESPARTQRPDTAAGDGASRDSTLADLPAR